MRPFVLAALSLLTWSSARAGDLKLDGFVDLRAIVPSDAQSWEHGGLGKLRFDGNGGQDVAAEIPQIYLQMRAQLAPEVSSVVVLRYAPDQKTAVDILEGYIRYRPVSTTPWRGAVKLGAFFPPISLENTDLGWMSPWTLTPSAINSWVGDELRTIGGEITIEHRQRGGDLSLKAALFAWNDPAGILLADRGWALGDKPTGLFDRLRLPDAVPRARGAPAPMHTLTYKEIDNRPGWYAGLSWLREGLGRLEVLRYDNCANPSAVDRQIAWRTEFWSAGVEIPAGDFTVLAQAMLGRTLIVPSATFRSNTDFHSAYVLLGWANGPYRLAARAEAFGTVERHPKTSRGPELSEHGHAITVAANWLPLSYMRLSAELTRLDSFRSQRETVGLSAHLVETQVLLNARVFF